MTRTFFAGVYICAADHRTPADEVRSSYRVIPCPHRITSRMRCGRLARLWEPEKEAPIEKG